MLNFLFKLYIKHKYGIKIYENVLSEEERVELLNLSKEHLEDLGNSYPGLQTSPNFWNQMNPKVLKTFMNVVGYETISKCWVNYTDGEMGYTSWHAHESKNTSVYYLDNPEGRGTIFKVGEKVFQIDSPTNSLMVIPGNMIHSVPENVTQPRYSLVIDTPK